MSVIIIIIIITSHESTSLKKSSLNCLKLAKQWYSILSEIMLFLW